MRMMVHTKAVRVNHSPMKNKPQLMTPEAGFYLGFLVWGRRSDLKLMVGGGLKLQAGVF